MKNRKSKFSRTFTTLRAFAVTLLMATVCVPAVSESAGPWKGQVVDKETGKPLERAVVLARWEKRYTSFVGEMGGNEYYDSEEVITDAEGRFVISARQTWTLNPLSEIYGPEFFIFKSGYGRWQFRDFDSWGLKDAIVSAERTRAEWRRFTEEGAVLELPVLKTKEQRIQSMQMPSRVPYERIPMYIEAINAERISFGLDPYNRSSPR
jgi:hypothetical protein